MAGMWYYSEQNQQKGPVPFEELKGLAQSGYLKPSDLVWEDGTPDWVRASRVDGLFDSSQAPAGRDGPPREPYGREDRAGDWNEPGPRPRRREDRYEDRPLRREAPRGSEAPRRNEGMSTGLKVGLIVGGAAFLLIILAVVLVLVLSSPGGRVTENYNVFLVPNQNNDRFIHFNANRQVEIQVTVDIMRDFAANVDVEVYEPGRPFALRTDMGFARNRFIRFTPTISGQYRIVIRNRGPGDVNSSVSIKQ